MTEAAGGRNPLVVGSVSGPEPEARPAAPAFRAVFDAEASYVCQVVRRLGVPERDVEDVAHDVFVAVHRRLEDFDTTLPMRPWLFGIAYRVAAAYRRRKSNRDQIMDIMPEAVDDAPAADETIHAAQNRALFLRALEALDEERRAVFVLHEIDGTTMPQIAAALNLPLNTAYSRLRLAREDFVAAARRLSKQGGHR